MKDITNKKKISLSKALQLERWEMGLRFGKMEAQLRE